MSGSSFGSSFVFEEKRDATNAESNFLDNSNNQEYLAEQLFLGDKNSPFDSKFTYSLLYELLDSEQLKLNSDILDTVGQLIGLPAYRETKINPVKVAQVLKASRNFRVLFFILISIL